MNFGFDSYAAGQLSLFEVETPDCTNPSSYCKGQLSLNICGPSGLGKL